MKPFFFTKRPKLLHELARAVGGFLPHLLHVARSLLRHILGATHHLVEAGRGAHTLKHSRAKLIHAPDGAQAAAEAARTKGRPLLFLSPNRIRSLCSSRQIAFVRFAQVVQSPSRIRSDVRPRRGLRLLYTRPDIGQAG